jgi:hypothetical protein
MCFLVFIKISLRQKIQAGTWWLTPIFLVLWKVEIGRIVVSGQHWPKKKNSSGDPITMEKSWV